MTEEFRPDKHTYLTTSGLYEGIRALVRLGYSWDKIAELAKYFWEQANDLYGQKQ